MMRAAAAALAAVFTLAVAGCGGRSGAAGSLGSDAAALVPPDALAFLTIDTNFDSAAWKRVLDLVPSAGVIGQLDRDVRPAVGDEVDLAVLGVDDDEPEVVAIVRPRDDTKLRELAARFDTDDEHYTVRRIGDWSVVADSPESFEAVRRAASGRSLEDVEEFREAAAELEPGGLAWLYTNGRDAAALPGGLGALVRVSGSPQWVAARLSSEEDALGLQIRSRSPHPAPAAYRPRLLEEVPSGAILAVSFKDADRALTRLNSEPALHDSLGGLERTLGLSLAQISPALRGEGVFYVTESALLPTFVLEVDSPTPQEAARALRAIADRIATKSRNLVSPTVTRRGNRVVLTNGLRAEVAGGPALVDDQPFKDALAAADVPTEVAWLAYADVERLAPLLQALSQLLGPSPPSTRKTEPADRLGALVAFGARSGSTSRVELRLGTR